MSEVLKKKQTAVRLTDEQKSDVEAIAMAWGVPQQEILERAIGVYMVKHKMDVKKGRQMQEELVRRRKEIG